MIRRDPYRFDDDDDDRPRRRTHRERDDDDFADDPGIIRRIAKPGNGTGIGGLICGILGILFTIGSGGLIFCVICCPLFAPFSWAIAGVGGLLGLVGLILGLVSRSQGNPTSVPIWAITLGSIAIVLAIVAIILPIVFVANLPAPPPPNNPQLQQPQFQPRPQPKHNANNKINNPKQP